MILVYPYTEKYNKEGYVFIGKKGLNKSLLTLNDKTKYDKIIANLEIELQADNSKFYNDNKQYNLTEIYLLKLISLLKRNGKLEVKLNIKDLSKGFLDEIFKIGSIIEFRDNYIIFEKDYITKNKNFIDFYNKKTELKKEIEKIKNLYKDIITDKEVDNKKINSQDETSEIKEVEEKPKRKRGRPRKKS